MSTLIYMTRGVTVTVSQRRPISRQKDVTRAAREWPFQLSGEVEKHAVEGNTAAVHRGPMARKDGQGVRLLRETGSRTVAKG